MSIVVTVHMYSGIPDPTWELTPDQAKGLRQIMAAKRSITLSQSPASVGRLGYRGFEIRSSGDTGVPPRALVFDGVLDIGETDEPNFLDSDSEVETFLVQAAGEHLRKEEKEYIVSEIQKNVSGGTASSVKGIALRVVPPFDPGKWNNDPDIKRRNNCYNYANDMITNTFAQPGRGSGQIGPNPPTCQGTGAAAVRDGEIVVASASSTPIQGHFITLVIWPGNDYHWYRLDSSGMWSHKPGQTSARNIDNSGNAISDPRNCDRGPYTQWCSFYHCIPAQVRIR